MNILNFSGSNNVASSVQTLVQNVVNQYIVRPTGLIASQGVSGYVFDIIDDEEFSVDSDITDHYVEANYAIQDHIALRPEHFTLRGYVAELGDIFQYALTQIYQQVIGLPLVTSFAPVFTQQATKVYETSQQAVNNAGQVVYQAGSAYNLFAGLSTTATKQQNAFQYFYNLWQARVLCNVETPFAVFSNMSIERVRALQRGTSRTVSDFEVTFKKMRIIKNAVTTSAPVSNFNPEMEVFEISDSYTGRAADMVSQSVNTGQGSGSSVSPTGNMYTTGDLSRSWSIPGQVGA